ncbi:hypothetical protein Tco_0068191 [Tanacetum coccineum]
MAGSWPVMSVSGRLCPCLAGSGRLWPCLAWSAGYGRVLAGIAGFARYASTLLIILSAKRVEGSFKVPRPYVSSMMASIDEDVENPHSLIKITLEVVYPAVDKIKKDSTVIQVEAKMFDSVKPPKNDLLDMLLPLFNMAV